MDHRRDYLKPARFGNNEKRRLLDGQNLKEKRNIRRTANFNLRRDIEQIAQDVKENITKNVSPKIDPLLDRKIALQRFKAAKEAQKKSLKDKKKPPFVVGIPHHGSSPLLKNQPLTEITSKREKVLTTQKFTFQPHKVHLSAKKLTSPHTPTVLKRSAQKIPFKNVSNLAVEQKKSPKNSHLYEVDEEELAAPLHISDDIRQEEADVGTQASEKKHEAPETISLHLSDASDELEVKKIDAEEMRKKGDDIELAKKVELQQSRLQSETTRLQELADRWKALVKSESLPQEVVDEVDSMVGQTHLLTSDKFQQFRRLIEQFENKTGTHPITWDDLNGFWDMVYLQVESLDKKYMALDGLKNNNWVNPEPATKKKRRPAKKLKVSQVTEVKPTTSGTSKIQNSLQLPEDSMEIQTPTTNMKQVKSNVLLKMKRTRSNSPSPYIAMRLSGVGRVSNIVGQTLGVDESPRSTLVNSVEPHGTPKSAVKKSLTALTASTKKRTTLLSTLTLSEEKIEEDDEKSNHVTATEEPLVPDFTPRRSTRLLTRQQPTPVRCIHCDSTSCDTSGCSTESISRSSTKTKRSKKQAVSPAVELRNTEDTFFAIPDTKGSASKSKRRGNKSLTFSPSEIQQKSESTTVQDNKQSTSGVRFSLRPSILTVTESNFDEIPKKTKKRRQTSLFTPSTTTTELDTAGPRRSTRQSRKVTFESGAEEKASLKLPATPYRKWQEDS